MFDDRSHTYTWPSELDTESVVEPEVDGIPRTTCHLVLGDSSGIEPSTSRSSVSRYIYRRRDLVLLWIARDPASAIRSRILDRMPGR